jgi:arsenical pump membrane protein
MATALAVAALVVVLGLAVLRPRGLSEAVAAVPAAVLLVALGVVPAAAARHELAELGPTVAFLAAVLALSHLADEAGVFRYAGAVAARLARGSAHRLLAVVFVIASVVTAALSLDATVVLLTPVVIATAVAVGARARPPAYACAHLANSASLLLPVSNLTNLLAFAASGLTFLRFGALMAGPWLAVIAVEYVLFRRFFAGDLAAPGEPEPQPPVATPGVALAILGLTLAGFAAAGPLGVHPAWVAAAGAAALAVRQWWVEKPGQRLPGVRRALASTSPAFLAFVLALGVVVLGVSRTGLGGLVARLTPDRPDLPGLLVMAGLAALLANLLNNLPATLMLVAPAAHSPALLLAMLLGVNIGPNLTFVGSLATLLWRRVLHAHDRAPGTAEFHRLGLVTVPACLAAGVLALWLATSIGLG